MSLVYTVECSCRDQVWPKIRVAANAKLTRERWSGQEPPSCNLSRSPYVGTYVQIAAHTTEVSSKIMANITDCGRPNTGTPTRDEVSQSESSPLLKDASVNETHSRIGALPDEILLRILECLPNVDSPRSNFTVMRQLRRPILDYASIALTCRSLNRAATTMMYRNYNHCYDHDPSTRFIRSLITNPALGPLVKEMKEVGHDGYNVTRSFEPMKPRARSSQTTQMICSKIETLDIPKGEEYTALFRKGEDASSALESALILYLTPNIEVVALNDCPEARVEQRSQEIILPETSYVQRQPQAALLPVIYAGRGIPYGRVHQFTRLRRLSIQMKGIHINFLSPILQLDSL